MKSRKGEQVMNLTIFSDLATRTLAEAVIHKLGLPLGCGILHRFPDGELHVTAALEEFFPILLEHFKSFLSSRSTLSIFCHARA